MKWYLQLSKFATSTLLILVCKTKNMGTCKERKEKIVFNFDMVAIIARKYQSVFLDDYDIRKPLFIIS